MHEHDPDLIADHADGSTSPEEAATARRLLESCPDCQAELRLQTEVRSALASVPPARLSEGERHALRSAVLERLGGAPVVALQARRDRRLVALGSVAAALVVMVGLAGALDVLGGSGDGATSAQMETAAEESSRAGEDGAGAEDGSDEAAGLMVEPDDRPVPPDLPVVDLGEVPWDVLREEVAQLEEQLGPGAPPLAPSDLDRAPTVLSCLDEEERILGVVTATVEGDRVEVFLVPNGDVTARAYRPPGCAPTPLP